MIQNSKKTIILVFILFISLNINADKLSHLRTSKKIVTVSSIEAPYYTIQIVALRLPPGEPEFFRDVENVREFVCTDGYVRYSVGQYSTFSEAARDLELYKNIGFKDVFVLNLKKISLDKDKYQSSSSDIGPIAGKTYTVQLAAYRFPVYISEFSEFDDVDEYYMDDKIYRYCVGAFDGSVAMQELSKIRRQGYPKAFLVPIDKYKSFKIE